MAFRRIATLVTQFVADELNTHGHQKILSSLSDPNQLNKQSLLWLRERAPDIDQVVADLRSRILQESYVLFENMFLPEDLPDTPEDFVSPANCQSVAAAKLAVVTLNCLCGLDTVSYGSENSGQLFVNLVGIGGTGAIAEKSQKSMRGHTDAASFPFRGTLDPVDRRIAPSPDVVCLASLRNPDSTPTVVIPLDQVLAKLTDPQIQLLHSGGFLIFSQRTFRLGTKAALTYEHSVDRGAILMQSPEGTWIRYSHSNVQVRDEEDQALMDAKQAFEVACSSCTTPISLSPGDVLFVNNRRALHGRGKVGDSVGGQSRWLLRTYGLDTHGVQPEQRHPNSTHILFP